MVVPRIIVVNRTDDLRFAALLLRCGLGACGRMAVAFTTEVDILLCALDDPLHELTLAFLSLWIWLSNLLNQIALQTIYSLIFAAQASLLNLSLIFLPSPLELTRPRRRNLHDLPLQLILRPAPFPKLRVLIWCNLQLILISRSVPHILVVIYLF